MNIVHRLNVKGVNVLDIMGERVGINHIFLFEIFVNMFFTSDEIGKYLVLDEYIRKV